MKNKKINDLTWYDLINKLKSILTDLDVASNEAPLPYSVYTALLTQTGTSVPTAVILENSLPGVITYSRVSQSVYRGTLTGAFTVGKTIGFLQTNNPQYPLSFKAIDANTFEIEVNGLEGIITNTGIEIRVYK